MEIKALIVDDSKVMRRMVMNSLRDAQIAKFRFVEAENGEVGLEKFKSDSPDILFVDWNMPKMSGVELVRHIRQTEKDIPIVMVTSEKGMGKMIEAIDEAGADDYVCKPFTVESFRKKVTPLLDKCAV